MPKITPSQVSAKIIVISVLTACAVAPDLPPPPPDIDVLLAELKDHLYTYISEERQRLNPDAMELRPDPLLAAAAQAHSDAMAERGAFDSGAEGNIAIQSLAADAAFQGYVAENSAMQYFYPTFGFDPEMFARGFVDQWLESESHRANIEYTEFAITGVGVAANGNEIYASGLFATQLSSGSAAD